LSIFLFFSPAQGQITSNTESRLLMQTNSASPIENFRYYKDGILYTSQGQLYYNFDPIKLINSNNGEAKINNIIIDKNDFYLLSDSGVFQNYRRIFSKEECFHLEKTTKELFLACVSGLYRSPIPSKNTDEYYWQIEANSPRDSRYFILSPNHKNILYAISSQGFYYHDLKQKNWNRRNNGLRLDPDGNYNLGRFYRKIINNKIDYIFLPGAGGVYTSSNKGQSWIRSNSGFKANQYGYHKIKELGEFDEKLYLITDTGIYFGNIALKNQWQNLDLVNYNKNENAILDIRAFDQHPFKPGVFGIATSQGQIIEVSPSDTSVINASPNESPIASKSTTIDLSNIDFFSCEPSIQELQIESMKFAGIPDGKDFDGYRRKAKIRNILPEFQTYVDRNNQALIEIRKAGGDSYNSNTSSISSGFDRSDINRDDNQFTAGLSLNWKLGNLIYDPEINDINTSARLTASIRENLLTEVTQIYFNRKSLLNDLHIAQINEEPIERDRFLELEKFTADLDARTGAWFSQELTKRNCNQLLKGVRT
jgi:hypothetical protein